MKFVPKKDGMDKFKKKIGQGFTDLIDFGIQISQEYLAPHEHYGTLSGSVVRVVDTTNFVFYFGYSAPHAPNLEFGSEPHWAPPVEIYEWVRMRLGKSGKHLEPSDSNAEYLFAIAFSKIKKRLSQAELTFKSIYKSIGVKGTMPHPYMRPTLKRMRTDGLQIIKAGYKR